MATVTKTFWAELLTEHFCLYLDSEFRQICLSSQIMKMSPPLNEILSLRRSVCLHPWRIKIIYETLNKKVLRAL
jgi:hypothetical protein